MTSGRGRALLRILGAGAAALLGCRQAPSLGHEPLPPSLTSEPAPAGSTAPVSAAPESPPRPSPSTPVPGPPRFAFDFDDAGLPELTRLLGAITGKRFILTGKLPVIHATVRSPEPVTAEEAYDAFLAILQTNGLTVVQSGRLWKILPSPGVPPEHTGN